MENLSKRELIALVDTAVEALKEIAEYHHECLLRGSVEAFEPHEEQLCRTCIANQVRNRIAQNVEEVPF